MKVNALLSVVFGALIAAHAFAVDEGIDYTELANPQPTESGDKIEVLEVFMVRLSRPHPGRMGQRPGKQREAAFERRCRR